MAALVLWVLISVSRPSCIYIDGFNLYYGALKNSSEKWLNIQKYFELLRTDDSIQKIWYFTVRISGPKQSNQDAYLRAVETLSLVDIVYGLYKQKKVKCRVPGCKYTGNREFRSTEEKGTDVNIALQMLDDAYQGLCERIVLGSVNNFV